MCPQKFSKLSAVNVHVRAVHDKVKYPCDICGKPFSGKEQIKRHVASVHENLRNIKCHLCTLIVKRFDHLKKHVARKHGLDIPIKELRILSANQGGRKMGS